jgi:hypothetical protein
MFEDVFKAIGIVTVALLAIVGFLYIVGAV